MNDIDPRIGHELRAIAYQVQPRADLWERVLHRVRARRRRRVSIAVLAGAGTIALALLVGTIAGRPPKRDSTVILQSPSTASIRNTTTARSAAPTTRTPTTINGASALATFIASHPHVVVHSTPFNDGTVQIAVVGIEPDAQHRSIIVVSLNEGTATQLANLTLPSPYYDLARHLPVQTADITGDGHADFLVRVQAADNNPGVVVSADSGSWRLIPLSNTPGDVYVGRNPTIINGQLRSTRNDCIPDCANGHTTTTIWRYDRQHQQLAAQ